MATSVDERPILLCRVDVPPHLQKELDDAKAALVAARKALEDFEEEARKAGVPAGWLR